MTSILKLRKTRRGKNGYRSNMAKCITSKGFFFFVKDVVLLVLFGSSLFRVSAEWCGDSDDCGEDRVCCNNICLYGSSCLGHHCTRTTGSYTDCAAGESCCNNVCVNGPDCVGQTCGYSAECGVGETCCNDKCTSGYDCEGQPCLTNADCGTFENCCGGTCGYDDCSADNTIWVVLGSTFASVFIIIALSILVRCIYRRDQRAAYGRVIEGQRVVPETSTSYLGQSPPSYQQGFPYYPPPRYEQHLPNNQAATKSSEPPPPYSAVPEGRSGGVSATPNNYGAVQNSSLPV